MSPPYVKSAAGSRKAKKKEVEKFRERPRHKLQPRSVSRLTGSRAPWRRTGLLERVLPAELSEAPKATE